MFLKENSKINEISNTLNKNGFVITKNIFLDDINDKFRLIAEKQIKKLYKKKFSLNEDYLSKTIIFDLLESNEIKNFFQSILQTTRKNYNYHFLLNHTPASKNKINKLSFHFDAFLLTMIIPINTDYKDEEETAMSINMVPNIRRETSFMLINLLYKLFFQNRFFRKFSNTSLFNYFFKTKKIEIKFNEIILFNGFRSLHSASISESKLQSEKTRLIIHIQNPFANNIINKIIFKNIQNDRDKKIK